MAVSARYNIDLDVSDLRFPRTRNNYKSLPGKNDVDAMSIPCDAGVETSDNQKIETVDEIFPDRTEETNRISELTRVAMEHVGQGVLTTAEAVQVIERTRSGTAAEWPMIEVLPVPRYVMKVKDESGCKFFINVCSHDSIQPGSRYLVPVAKESISTDGLSCVVYDAVLSETDVSTSMDDAMLASVSLFTTIMYNNCFISSLSFQVSSELLKAVAHRSGKPIPPQEPAYPKTKNNYKASVQSPVVGKVLVPDPNYTKSAPVPLPSQEEQNVSQVTNDLHASDVPKVATAAEAILDNGSYVLPEPAFVVKTKRSDGIKYFVNICDHDDVPQNRITTSSTIPKESAAKDGSTCHVFDVCLNRTYLHTILGNQTTSGDQLREEVRVNAVVVLKIVGHQIEINATLRASFYSFVRMY